ncbi:MAG: nucleotidyl transferase AbiEii/AbiGii toxin family protein [Minisyncoccia bacterium]
MTVAIEDINFSFVKYPFPVISKFITYEGVKILPALEIGAMKAYALGKRATLKDYVDLYFLLKEKVCVLEEIIKLAEKKYKGEFDPRLFLEQLIYSKDVEEMEIQFLKEKVTKKEIEKFFEKEVKKIKS